MSPRRRVLLVGVLALLAGYSLPRLVEWLLSAVWWRAQEACVVLGLDTTCKTVGRFGLLLPQLALLALVVLAVAAIWGAARWCLRPVR